MRGVVVYESMFGNTRQIAEAIADALSNVMEVWLRRADLTTDVVLHETDLLVVGAPTHAWSMPRPNTRKGALTNVRKPGSDLTLEPNADSLPGVREWRESLGDSHIMCAVFDTRFSAPSMFTGRASKAILKELHRYGIDVVIPAESFIVDRRNHLIPGEVERARTWGLQLGDDVVSRSRVRP